jgi:hypothetical protein
MGASIMEKSALSIFATDSNVLPEPFAGEITAVRMLKEVNDNMIKHDDKMRIKGLMYFMVKKFWLSEISIQLCFQPSYLSAAEEVILSVTRFSKKRCL